MCIGGKGGGQGGQCCSPLNENLGEGTAPHVSVPRISLDEGAPPHQFRCARDHYRVQYYEACNKVKMELESQFNEASC